MQFVNQFVNQVAQLLLGAAVALAATPRSTDPGPPLATPTSIAVRFSDSTATITWNAVPGSQGYGVTIRPLGEQGPGNEEQVLANTYTVPFTNFPGYGRFTGGYAYQVCSMSVHAVHACTATSNEFYVRSDGHGVSTSNLRRAANKVSSCLGKGEEAGLVVAAGMGVKAAVASWIPGIDAVTAGGVAAASAGAGAAKFAACRTGW